LKAVCEDFSSNKKADLGKQNIYIKKEIDSIEKMINQLEARILSTNDPKVIGLYERRLRENIDKKQLLEAKLECRQINTSYDLNSLFSDTRNLLENPCNIWAESDIEKKRLLVRVLFSDKISY
jgi:methanogenic corrinoid protein MtbC1